MQFRPLIEEDFQEMRFFKLNIFIFVFTYYSKINYATKSSLNSFFLLYNSIIYFIEFICISQKL